MASPRKALITGGAGGLGLAVAQSLLADGWSVSLLDMDKSRGDEAVNALGSSTSFHHVNVTKFAELSAAFEKVFEEHHRLDFVFANAGVVSAQDFYTTVGAGTEPSYKTLDVVLNGVVNTSGLARHYFTQADNKAEHKNLIVTASCGGFYAVPYDPLYAAAKHGVIGFVRSIAVRYHKDDGVRVNAICPGLMRTNILPDQMYEAFPEAMLTPVERVVKMVKVLLDGEEHVGQTVEMFRDRLWFRKQAEYCEPEMAALMGVTDEL